jgi:hypothetical protein
MIDNTNITNTNFKDEITMDKDNNNENDIINLKINKEDNYKSLTSMICPENPNERNFLKEMLEKIQKISLFIRKLKIEEDPTYYETQSKEYTKLLSKAKMKIEKIIQKTIIYAHKNMNVESELPNINK